MPINRGMDKEQMVYIYNGILLSHKKNKIKPFAATRIGPGVCHTELSKLDIERQISYNIAYM